MLISHLLTYPQEDISLLLQFKQPCPTQPILSTAGIPAKVCISRGLYGVASNLPLITSWMPNKTVVVCSLSLMCEKCAPDDIA